MKTAWIALALIGVVALTLAGCEVIASLMQAAGVNPFN